LIINKTTLDYSRVEVAADAVRAARLEGKKIAIKIRNKNKKKD